MSNNNNNPRLLTSEEIVSPQDLAYLFYADFENGVIYWKQRSIDSFATKRAASIWNKRFAGKPALTANHKSGYKHGLIYKKAYLTHRVIYAMKHGYWPEYIDHINGNRMDNRIENLRSVTKSENSCNSSIPTNNTSGHIGVSWNARDQRWSAYITFNRKRKALGNFVNIEDAIICRKENENLLGFHPNHGKKL